MDASNATTRFDFILDRQGCSNSAIENTVLFETNFFAVVPSLGSLVPGWLLVVPKRRVLNCGMLTEGERSELKNLIQRLSKAQECFPGRVFAFEHGPTDVGSLTGCGVDHAHMHLVPLEFDLLAVASGALGVRWDERMQGNILDRISGCKDEYVVVYDVRRDLGVLGRPSGQNSQWVRKIVAAQLERSNEWDYRAAPHRDIIAATVNALKSAPTEEA